MTRYEIEKAIALHQGWKYDGGNTPYSWISPGETGFDSPPPYTRCLNVMALAVNSIPADKKRWYDITLINICPGGGHGCSDTDMSVAIRADAHQQATAYCDTFKLS